VDVVSQWKKFADQTGVEGRQIEAISRTHRLLKK
jgi:hypothetical protein